MSILTRPSVLALVEETTEGTPVLPTSATQYVALQDSFTIKPAFEVLNNAELKASIGLSEPILGAESPTASLDHYLRNSGVVAQAPNYGLLLKASLGAVTTAGAEYDTVAASTTTVIKVDTGEGASFQRGEALLIKDGTNGYRIRCIDSISSDNLTIGFQVPSAPASGVNLGRAVLYYPANSGHITLTVWYYLGNAGAIEMIAGTRVTSASFDLSAGQLINGSYSLEATSFYFNPINITSTDRYLDFTDDDGTFAAVITAKVYKDPHDLAAALTTAMNSANAGETHTVTYSNSTGKFTIISTGTVLSILWNTGTNAANTVGDKIGFSVAADDTGVAASTGYTSDNAVSFAAPQTPSYDSASPLAAKDNEVMLGLVSDYVCFEASKVTFAISTPKTDKESVCAVSGKSGSIINSREVTISVEADIAQYDASEWKEFRAGDSVKFQYSFGIKSGGNWVAGSCGALYAPTAKISSFEITNNNGLANVSLELKAYVNSSGEGEVFVNFV